MRFFPQVDPDFYVEINNCWDNLPQPNISWKITKFPRSKTIGYYRDVEGAKIETIGKNELNFPDAPENNRRENAFLPTDYRGTRFILLQQTHPHGFNSTPVPHSLGQLMEMERIAAELAQKEKEERKLRAKMEKEQMLLNKKKAKK